MFEQTLSADAQSNLAAVGQTSLAQDFYLAGGTAMALHFGHRTSYDLDFFAAEHFSIDRVLKTLAGLGQVDTFQATEDTFNGKLNDFRISFFIYPYPILDAFLEYRGTQIASIADLAAMKVDAITRRGRKRDFIDLFTICKQSIPLGQALDLYFRKFANFNISQVHVLKSLVYFGDAETDEMPNLLQPVGWKAVKTFFEKEVGQLYRSKTVRINKS